jgi:hypothetical protein
VVSRILRPDDGGIVDNDVQPAELLHGILDQPIDVLPAHVGLRGVAAPH